MPLSSGFDVITTNYGSLNNRGIEVEVKVQVMPKKSELQWELGFNASHVKTKIRKLRKTEWKETGREVIML